MSQTEAYFAHWVQTAVLCIAARSYDAERFPRQSRALPVLCWHTCESRNSLHCVHFSSAVRLQKPRECKGLC